jgi:hypothetical protein
LRQFIFVIFLLLAFKTFSVAVSFCVAHFYWYLFDLRIVINEIAVCTENANTEAIIAK